MLFNSLQFLIFLPIVMAFYLMAPQRLRPALLVVASCVFYMAFIPAYILILWLLIGIDYAAGLWLQSSSGPRKKAILILSLLSNVGILGFFKYWNFLATNLNQWLGVATMPLQSFLLPIGLSFHTFQSMAYTIEVFRGNFAAERNLVRYSLYVLFFPQMVAGPIERPTGLLAQIQAGPRMAPERTVEGLRLMLLGFTKKCLLADRLAPFVAETFDHCHDYLGPRLWLAAVFFSVQIYCDFSGYSDIARGVAKLLGYELCINFKRPYASLGIGEFWHRWHISLSSWFRDFLYFPLGGSRRGPARALRNLMVVFLLSGLWHGANWTFVMWGAIHGLGLCVEKLFGRRLPAALGWSLTWVWVLIGWVFFRAKDFPTACYVIWGGALGWSSGATSWEAILGSDIQGGLVNLLMVGLFLVYQVVAERKLGCSAESILAARPAAERHILYFLMMIVTLLMGRFSGNDFIYFQF